MKQNKLKKAKHGFLEAAKTFITRNGVSILQLLVLIFISCCTAEIAYYLEKLEEIAITK